MINVFYLCVLYFLVYHLQSYPNKHVCKALCRFWRFWVILVLFCIKSVIEFRLVKRSIFDFDENKALYFFASLIQCIDRFQRMADRLTQLQDAVNAVSNLSLLDNYLQLRRFHDFP